MPTCTWLVSGASCCSCCALITLAVSIMITRVTNIGMVRGEGFFCDCRCNDEAAERYDSAAQETCYDDSGEWISPCDWSNVTDKPGRVEPVEGHYHCYFGACPSSTRRLRNGLPTIGWYSSHCSSAVLQGARAIPSQNEVLAACS